MHTAEPGQTIDLTGLPEHAVRAVESLVALLRQQANPSLIRAPYEEWSRAFHEWAEGHKPQCQPVDWNRESIYVGRGE
jgi:hypothetical protein